jgi:uncharacterized membrane-anchored protein YitT (DUF2179 family)
MPVKKVKKLFSAETQRIKKLILWSRVRSISLTLLWVGSAFFGLEWFLLPNGFLDGWVTWASLLLNSLTWIELGILIFAINIPFFILGYFQIGLKFAIKSFFAVLALVLMLKFVDIWMVTDDKLLVAIFGWFFLWAGIGLAVRWWSVIDGTEILAVFVSKNSILSVGDFIGIFNVCLFLIAAFFIGIEVALYSMLTYIAASKTVDFVIQWIEEYTGVTIISKKAWEIERMIVQVLWKGVTVIDSSEWFGTNGVDDHERKILFSVVTRLEVQKMMIEVQKIDENAFITHHPISHVKWWTVKKRPLH